MGNDESLSVIQQYSSRLRNADSQGRCREKNKNN